MKHGDFATTLANALHAADAMRDGRLLPEEVGGVLQMPQLGLSGQQQYYLQQLFSPDLRDGYCDYRTALLRSVLWLQLSCIDSYLYDVLESLCIVVCECVSIISHIFRS